MLPREILVICIVLLFHLETIHLPVLISSLHMYEMWPMNRLWLTQNIFASLVHS